MENQDWSNCVMYILVNTSLKMKKGKIAAQCCHGACRTTRFLESLGSKKPLYYKNWINFGETKVVLKITSEQIQDILKKYQLNSNTQINDLWCVSVVDAGKTQIEPLKSNGPIVITFSAIILDTINNDTNNMDNGNKYLKFLSDNFDI